MQTWIGNWINNSRPKIRSRLKVVSVTSVESLLPSVCDWCSWWPLEWLCYPRRSTPKAGSPVAPKLPLLQQCPSRNIPRHRYRSPKPVSSGLIAEILEWKRTFVSIPVLSRCWHLPCSVSILIPSHLTPSLTHLKSYRLQSKVQVLIIPGILLHGLPLCCRNNEHTKLYFTAVSSYNICVFYATRQ